MIPFDFADALGRSFAHNPELSGSILGLVDLLEKNAGFSFYRSVIKPMSWKKKLVGAGALAGTGYGAYKGIQYAAKKNEQFQNTPYQHGMTGGTTFNRSWQM